MRKYYIVGNRAFNSFCEATEYCEECDFDGETMITEVNDGQRMGKYDATNSYNIGYKNPDIDLKTIYTIEYITNKRDFERAYDGKHPAPWELYLKYKTEDLQQAMTVFLAHYASALTYDVKLFEEIYVNGELIREQCITDITNFSRICDDNKKKLTDIIYAKDEIIDMQAEEIETIKAGFAKFGKDAYDKFIREQSAYAYNLVLSMYERNMGYDPYDSRTGRKVFRAIGGTSMYPMEFKTWQEVREWLDGIAD